MDVRRIRDESLAAAKRLGVDVLTTLPVLDADLEMRSSGEVASRLLAMHVVASTTYGYDRATAIGWLTQEGLLDYLTDPEKGWVFDGEGQALRFQLQIEGMWALAWALGIVNEIDFAKDCDDNFVLLFPNLKQNEGSAEFRAKINPRPLEELVAALDLAYCLHWAIRDAEIRDKQPAGKLKPYVVIERRQALEWLLSKDEWDDVMMDT